MLTKVKENANLIQAIIWMAAIPVVFFFVPKDWLVPALMYVTLWTQAKTDISAHNAKKARK